MNARLVFAACMATCIGTMQVEGVNAFSYVQKGLVACYDGIENAGAGTHDPNATTWVDLTGNGNDGTVGSGITSVSESGVGIGSVKDWQAVKSIRTAHRNKTTRIILEFFMDVLLGIYTNATIGIRR